MRQAAERVKVPPVANNGFFDLERVERLVAGQEQRLEYSTVSLEPSRPLLKRCSSTDRLKHSTLKP
jgi:hypothetical protein